jgi:hypothetical protein
MAITLDGTNGITTPDLNATAQTSNLVTTGDISAADLTLSGGVYLGGTGSANLLDDYEEGTYTATITPLTSGSVTLNASFDTLSYTKVGRKVSITGLLIVLSVSSPVGRCDINLPFSIASAPDRASDSSGTARNANLWGIENTAFMSLANLSTGAELVPTTSQQFYIQFTYITDS